MAQKTQRQLVAMYLRKSVTQIETAIKMAVRDGEEAKARIDFDAFNKAQARYCAALTALDTKRKDTQS